MKKVIIVGAGGRDFHNFNVAFRDNEDVEVVAFTAAQIPGIDDRVYPPALAGRLYPHGIRVVPEERLTDLIDETHADEVVFAYSDVSHEQVMHTASIVLAAGADFRLMGPKSTMIRSTKPVVSVCAVRTGAGKSQTSRRVGQLLLEAGLKVALVRHPMPYHDLEAIRVERFTSLGDIDRSNPTIEEREEYERPVETGLVVYAGVDYKAILEQAQDEADVVIWDGGNNDFPFVKSDLAIVVADPLRPGDAHRYHPGEANLRMADVVLINKTDTATPQQVMLAMDDVAHLAPRATVVQAQSPITLEDGPSLTGKKVLVVEDGPTVTHGGMDYGAGMVAARQVGAKPIDPRPFAVGSVAQAFTDFPHVTEVLPAMGYGADQLRELEETIDAADCEAVIAGTPIELDRVVKSRHPIRHVSYRLVESGRPDLSDVLEPVIARAHRLRVSPDRVAATQ
jgi:predicted GTPase